MNKKWVSDSEQTGNIEIRERKNEKLNELIED